MKSRLRTGAFRDDFAKHSLSMFAIAAASFHATPAVAAPFVCSDDVLQVQSGQLRKFDTTDSSYIDIGTPVSPTYNAIGYNRLDNYLYGMQGNNVIRIEADGSVSTLYTIAQTSFSGDVDDSNNLIISTGSGGISKINLATGAVTSFTASGRGFGGADLVFVQNAGNDYVLGIAGGRVRLVDLNTEVGTRTNVAGLPTSGSFGAVWIDRDDRILTFENNTGRVFEILNPFTATPSARLIATGTASGSNDGSFCPLAGFPNFAPLAKDDSFSITTPTFSSNVLADNGGGVDNDPDGDPITVRTTIVTAPTNGSVSIAANGDFTYTPTPGFSGTDTFVYRISDPDGLTDDATVTITVTPPVVANNDTVTGVNGASGATAVANAFSGDLIAGAAATSANATLSVASGSSVPTGLSFDTATGNVDVAPGTPAGTYSFDYEICDRLTPPNCETATISVTVDASAIVATNDSVSGVNGASGATGVTNAFAGDQINGANATNANAILSVRTGSMVPNELTFDPVTGNVDVVPGTPAGTYSFDYTICERLNPTNCRDATISVTVAASPIVVSDDSVSGVNGASGDTAVVNAFTGDMINGAAASTANAILSVRTGSTVPAGLNFDPATGNVDVQPGTAAGTYSFDYTICERLNPTNCLNATISVRVAASAIVATNDSVGSINGASGGNNILNVFDGDTINSSAANSSNAILSVRAGTTVPPQLTFDPATGAVDVAPNTPAGTYNFEYTICERLNPSNCRDASVSITVVAAPVVATNDSATGVNGASGATAVTNAFSGDLINGSAASAANATLRVAPGSSVPSALSFDTATGQVDVAAGTPAGTYSFDYQICENLNPSNCRTATISITVDAAPVVATNDSVSGVNGASGATGVANAFNGDTINGSAANSSNAILSVMAGSSVPAGLVFDPATGNVDVAAGTAAGTYSFSYTICERLNPTNCRDATISVMVAAAPIIANPDMPSSVNGATGNSALINAFDNDRLNGNPIVLAEIDATIMSAATPAFTGAPVPAMDPSTGIVSVPAGTPAGSYSIRYQICEQLNLTNCQDTTIAVVVDASNVGAVNDTVTGVIGASGGTDILDVFDGDTINGVQASPTNAILSVAPTSSLPSELTFDPATGSVGLVPGTPAGTYGFDYQICERLNPTNCRTASVMVVVDVAPIVAGLDTPPPVNGVPGNPALINAYDNDRLNGSPIDPADIIGTISTPATPASPGAPVPAMDPSTGIVSVPAATPAGSYDISYQICERINPTNCRTSTITVTVEASPLVATADTPPAVNGASGNPSVVNVYDNDMLNGSPVDPADIAGTVLAPATPATPGAPVPSLDPATGNVAVPAGTPAGSYTITYQICEILNPANCRTALVTVVVDPSAMDVQPDDPPAVNGADGNPAVINVYDNDMLNGSPVDVNAIDASVTTAAEPVVAGAPVPILDPSTGIISVPPGTPAGNYTIVYEICETLNPTNCQTGQVAVVVDPAAIEAMPDMPGPIDSTAGDPEAVNVYANDQLNGETVSLDDITGTVVTAATPANPGDPVPVLDPVTGNVAVPPGTPAGSYEITYEICENLNPANCNLGTATIAVEPPVAGISGVVFVDANDDGIYQEGEDRLQNWVVEILDTDGDVVATSQTDENGFYQVDALPLGEYSVTFRNPANGVMYGSVESVNLSGGNVTVDQNLPIDPSGVVYDAVTRQPVANTVLTLVDGNGNPLPTACFIDAAQQNQLSDVIGFYRFDIVPGAAAACPVGETDYRIVFDAPGNYSDQPSTVIAPQPDALNPPAGAGSFAVAPQPTAPVAGEDTTYYLSFILGTGDRDVINNHIALDPFENRSPLIVSKTSIKRSASVGDLIPYTITVRNAENVQRSGVDIVDIIPPGFKYVPGSAIVNNVASEPASITRELRWTQQVIPANGSATYNLTMVVGSGVTGGDRINTAVARNGLDASEISNRGQAVVAIVPSAVFDCAEIIGKVFDDRDGDGYQDQGEPGLANVRLANVNGQLITTDAEGRYHITCAAVPDARIGSNYVLKLDTRTLPSGYAVTSENPRAVRLTRGKITKLNFGAKMSKRVAVAVDSRAFPDGSAELRPPLLKQLSTLRDKVEPKNPVIRITYAMSAGEDMALAKARVEGMARAVETNFGSYWDGPPASIETNVVRTTSNSGGE